MKAAAIVVIGAGVAGSAAALHLARAGHRVRLFDRFEFGHSHGSSHGPTRLFRLAYFEHADYVPLLRRSLEGWRRLEREAGRTLFIQSGVLEAGPPEGFVVSGLTRTATEHGLEIERVSKSRLKSEFPWLSLPAGDEAIIERVAGFLYAEAAVSAQLELAQRAGALLHPGERILRWTRRPQGFVAESSRGKYTADRIIVATGAWAPELLGKLDAPITPMQKALFWIGAGASAFHVASGFIPFAIETPDARMFYGFPAIDSDGIKFGEHTGGAGLSAPEARSGAPAQTEREAAAEFLRRFTPGLPIEISKESTCLYEMSPDSHFLIGRSKDDERISFAAGLSGHGFKFAPVIGEALADLALDKPLSPEFAFLDPARFRTA